MKTSKRKTSLLVTSAIAVLSVLSLGVSTYAWFQANAEVSIHTTSEEATITVAAPESVKFYYFKGNGTPGSDYTGYSKKGAAFGNTTNIIGISSQADKFSTNGGSTYVSINSFTDAWGEINLSNNTEVQNAFNFSKMRAGCYYSFLIETNLGTSTVKTSYDWTNDATPKGITGDNLVNPLHKRYLNGGSNVPINLLMAINGYCKEFDDTTTDAVNYINETVGLGPGSLGLTDRIDFPSDIVASGEKTKEFTLLNSATTSTNKYIYFTIFMGTPTKNDAYRYVSTDGSIDYYEASTNGTYSVFDGLRSTIVSISVS